MNAHDMLPSDSEPRDPEPDACTCCACSSCYRNSPCNSPSCVRCWPVPTHITTPPIPFSITGPGEYKTREGCKAIVTDVYDGRAFGRYCSPKNNWYGTDWELSGQRYYISKTCFDIVSKWEEPRKPVKGWMILYNNGDYGCVWPTKRQAEENAVDDFICVIKVHEVTDD